MRHALANEAWQTLLPESSDWLDKVKVAGGPATVAGAHHVIAVRTDDAGNGAAAGKDKEKDKDAYTIDAPKLPAALVDRIKTAAHAIGWRPGAGSVHLAVDGLALTLVPVSSTKVGPRQLARQLGLDAAKAVKELKIAHLALCATSAFDHLEVFEGYAAGLYAHGGFKGSRKRDAARFPAQVTLAGGDASADAVSQTLELARSAAICRFLQDAPANWLTPAKFAEVAKDLARDGKAACKVFDKEEMTRLGMGCLLAVSDGSAHDPRTIVMEIDGVDNSRCVALVGKGLTFDAGGISLKPASGMEEMKYDMSGGAAVLGAARYFTKVKPPVKVVMVIGAVENMPSGSAIKPGDLVRAMNGKTVEVHNTDAEGRLVLADCLHYVISEYKPEMVVDIATLTGAVLIALGCVGAGLLTNDEGAAERVTRAGEQAGEPLWRLPLWPELEKETKSDVGDLKNIAKGNVKAGTIMGAMFLKEFVGDTKWVHLDIAGTGWNCQATGFPAGGGSAFGMRTLIRTCQSFG